MKRIFLKPIILLVVFTVFQSCSDDYLDLDPTEDVSEADVFATTTNIWGALNGIHRFMWAQFEGSQSHSGHSGNMQMYDHLGEDLVNHARGTGWFIGVYNWTHHRNESGRYTRLPYRFFYQLIANANMIIYYVDDAAGPLNDKEHLKGQALAYRAWAYHHLVQMYAKRYDWNNVPNEQAGVPLVLTPTLEPQPRASVEDVYEQINADLTQAIGLLDGKTITQQTITPKSHISVDIARGMKARVALAQGNWQLAAQLAGEARQGRPLMSHAELLEGFSDKENPEFMWVSHVQEDQRTFFYSFYSYMSWNFASTMIRANPKKICGRLFNMISDTDVRKQHWAATAEEGRERQPNTDFTAVEHMSFKFKALSESDSRGDVCYMRTAEMYLIEAEALARSGDEGGARSVLFELISERDPEYTISNNSGEDLIEEILTHRRIELWGEGFRWLDLKRLNLPLDRDETYHSTVAEIWQVPAGDNRWQVLIPRDELNANPLISQNE